MAKKTSKKTAKKTGTRTAAPSENLPTSSAIPKGMKQMGGGYAPTWITDEIGKTIHGNITATVRTVEFKGKGKRKSNESRVIEITTLEGDERFAVWESAALGATFDAIAAMGEDAIGKEIFIRFDGLGKKKPGQNATKLFTVAMAE